MEEGLVLPPPFALSYSRVWLLLTPAILLPQAIKGLKE